MLMKALINSVEGFPINYHQIYLMLVLLYDLLLQLQ